ncbi:hypothetical protein [Pseudomonas sp. 18058]|uniref:hypothetical protein n=1 Tax=Pseudomonas sp. 18058 TaxID=2681406 RepID=UPI0013583293|nr:hypothetical protein [Pseudomonas sp. 18058]
MLNDYGKSLFKPWLSVSNVVLGLSALFVLVLLVKRSELTSGELASWVQAVGSILAIVGALAVGRSQSATQNAVAVEQINHQIAAKKQEVTDRAIAFLAVVDCAATLCNAIYETVAEDQSIEMMKAVWNTHLKEVTQANLHALRGIPVYELGSYELVVAHGTVLATFVKFISETEIVVAGGQSMDFPENMGPLEGMKQQNALMQAGFGTFKDAHEAKHGKLLE